MRLVAEAMNRTVVTIDRGRSLEEAADVLRRTGAEHVLVVDGDHVVGILCGCDLRGARPQATVSEWMSLPIHMVRPDAPVEEASEAMAEREVSCLPVGLGGLVLGTLSEAELEREGMEPSPRARCRRHPHRRRSRRQDC